MPSKSFSFLSIPPWFDCGDGARAGVVADHPTFNPTLVRLRRQPRAAAVLLYPPFNPTLVRLRLPRLQLRALHYIPFNPTLVRLRPGAPAPPGDDTPFQSHLGSIAAEPR